MSSSDHPQPEPVLTWTATQPQNSSVLDDSGPEEKDLNLLKTVRFKQPWGMCRNLVTSLSLIRYNVSPYGIYSRQSELEQVFLPQVIKLSSVSIIPPMLHINLLIH